MVKAPQKPKETKKIPLNNSNLTPKLDNKLSKSRDSKGYNSPKKTRKQIYQENYQKNKEKKKSQQKERYHQQKLQAENQTQAQLSKYSQASAYKILMNFNKYTELNKEKHKLWLDFNWTLKDFENSKKEGHVDITSIMKIEQIAHKLVQDYWATAKSEKKQKSKSWNVLSSEEQDRLIKYWGYEKARIENGYLAEEERLEKQSQEYLKEIELTKFHEERGKIKCECYACEEKQAIRKEVQGKIKKELEEKDADREKGKCCVCGKIRELEEDGACKKCSESYEG